LWKRGGALVPKKKIDQKGGNLGGGSQSFTCRDQWRMGHGGGGVGGKAHTREKKTERERLRKKRLVGAKVWGWQTGGGGGR